MVVTNENKTYFVSSRLHLPHVWSEEEPTATFCQINYVNINGVKWKLQNTAYLKFLYIREGLKLLNCRRNEWSQFAGVLTEK
jgi:hypothetical protein